MTHRRIKLRKHLALCISIMAIVCLAHPWGIASGDGSFMNNCPIDEPLCDVGPGGSGYPVRAPFTIFSDDQGKPVNRPLGDEDNSCIVTPDECWEDYQACLQECDLIPHDYCYADCEHEFYDWCGHGMPPDCTP
jgi:hypothetical protein